MSLAVISCREQWHGYTTEPAAARRTPSGLPRHIQNCGSQERKKGVGVSKSGAEAAQRGGRTGREGKGKDVGGSARERVRLRVIDCRAVGGKGEVLADVPRRAEPGRCCAAHAVCPRGRGRRPAPRQAAAAPSLPPSLPLPSCMLKSGRGAARPPPPRHRRRRHLSRTRSSRPPAPPASSPQRKASAPTLDAAGTPRRRGQSPRRADAGDTSRPASGVCPSRRMCRTAVDTPCPRACVRPPRPPRPPARARCRCRSQPRQGGADQAATNCARATKVKRAGSDELALAGARVLEYRVQGLFGPAPNCC